MIAPARPHNDTQNTQRDARLRRARRMVAQSMLGEESDAAPTVASVAPWKAWLAVGWIVVVAACYVVTLLSGRP